ncbi:MAG TPA: hypothetical protein PLN36_10470, partial [Bacteroidales bacterium]|nr:hypothetical protein [Bacteroidales bacterium]
YFFFHFLIIIDITNHHPPSTNHQPPTTNYQLPTTNYQLPTTNYQLQLRPFSPIRTIGDLSEKKQKIFQ